MESLSQLPHIKHLNSGNFFLIAGPCVIEDEEMAEPIARKLNNLSNKYQVPFIFKASYRKANRSRLDSFTGIGDIKALRRLKHVSDTLKIPVLTDIHKPLEAKMAAEFVDIIQIPAFLCRQTELLVAAAKTGKVINIKKGQFLSPEAMKHTVSKIRESGNDKIWLTERGTSFGYQDLIVDMRSIPTMQKLNTPVILDVTHSLQQPNQSSGVTGGKPEMIETLSKAGVAAGADGIFIETHPNPAQAKSDGANMLPLDKMDELLGKLVKVRQAIR
ncbi:MAG: 3-deoxy-8-phosphooctulonate synthase [Bacteroidota bacterium]|nr:3-deoxy-8-phosphooctulonate synthase [Bacteroidota bacterium]